MKKNYFLGAAAAFGLLAFSSCSNDEDPILGPDNQELMGEQVIVLDMQDTDVLSTKSRPLYSTTNKGAEEVTDVQLLAFGYDETKKQYKYVKKLPAITNWNNASDPYDYGRKYEIKLTGDDKLPVSTSTDPQGYSRYIILAVGQDESDLTSTPAPFKIELGDPDKYVKELDATTWDASTNIWWNIASDAGNGFLKTAAIENTKSAGEIFSGVSKPIEFAADGGFSTTVLLKRQVAGVLGYFNRIPAKVGDDVVTGIRLVSSNKNNSLDLSKSLAVQVDDATHKLPGYKNTESVVNGFTVDEEQFKPNAKFKNSNNAYSVYKINLKDWFEWNETGGENGTGYWDDKALLKGQGEDGSDLLGNVTGWHNALDAANSKVVVADGAVLAGEFVIPFKNETTDDTFELQLINEDGENTTVLKAWVVKLDPMSQSDIDHDRIYNIYRNHLYQVGKRGSGDNPTDPGTDPDKPQPLDKDQELVIKINDNWEFIHDMEIE